LKRRRICNPRRNESVSWRHNLGYTSCHSHLLYRKSRPSLTAPMIVVISIKHITFVPPTSHIPVFRRPRKRPARSIDRHQHRRQSYVAPASAQLHSHGQHVYCLCVVDESGSRIGKLCYDVSELTGVKGKSASGSAWGGSRNLLCRMLGDVWRGECASAFGALRTGTSHCVGRGRGKALSIENITLIEDCQYVHSFPDVADIYHGSICGC
jgi:hypothetical protein